MKFALWAVTALMLLSFIACGVTSLPPDSRGWTEANSHNYAPASRVVSARSVFAESGNVVNAPAILNGGTARLNGQGAQITLDFGYEVAGIVSLTVAGSSDSNQSIGIAFSESSLYVGPQSDDSSAWGIDGFLTIKTIAPGAYFIPQDKLRGGFRYLTLFLNSGGWVDLSGVSLHFTASPGMANLRAYPNYFLSSDDLLNKIWYAGAYTVQLNTIDPHQGRVWPTPTVGWENNAFITDGSSVLVDGAKRDRTIWPGDLGISQTTAFASTGDTNSTRNVLNVLFSEQDSDGGLPYCGPPVNCGTVSDTYHLWTLIAAADFYRDTRDKTWLDDHWLQYKAGVQFSLNKVDANGLMSVTLPADWGRIIPLSGKNLSPNVLLYRVLTLGAGLANEESDVPTAQRYRAAAAVLRQAVNSNFWDEASGQYRDAAGEGLYPQDGNSLALWFGIVDSFAKAQRISHALRSNWNYYGAQTPERPNAIATFPGSMEVVSHFAADDDQAGLDLIRKEWGYMLNSPLGTQSTFWEGYLADGTFDYATSSMSEAHGWATGPTFALTYYVLGIMPAMDQNDYTLVPHPGDLTRAEGRLTLAVGPADAMWEKHSNPATFTMQIRTSALAEGSVGVPTFGLPARVLADERVVWDACGAGAPRISPMASVSTDGTYVYLAKLKGSHKFESVPCEYHDGRT